MTKFLFAALAAAPLFGGCVDRRDVSVDYTPTPKTLEEKAAEVAAATATLQLVASKLAGLKGAAETSETCTFGDNAEFGVYVESVTVSLSGEAIFTRECVPVTINLKK